jgi:hypothetical protein
MAIALVALFVALGGTSYAVTRIDRDSVRSHHIVNDAVTTADIQGGGGRTGTIKNRDTNALLAIPKGYATIQGGPVPAVLNYGGQQTRTEPTGVTVSRVSAGVYDVIFAANTGTGRFVKVDSTNDLAVVGTGATAPGGSEPIVIWNKDLSSANENQVRLRIRVEDASSGNPVNLAQFSVFFYTRTVN